MERWMLERIKYKSMVLVSSLIEENSESLAIKRIMRSLPIEILKQNIVSIYKNYQRMYPIYSQEAFKHIDADPDDPDLEPDYHELILETGFYMYFLITYYSELDTQEIDYETSSELQSLKNNVGKDSGFLDMKNSLIGQLASFALAIIGGVLGVINTIRTEIQRRAMELLMKSGGPDAEELERMAALKKQRQLEVFRETI